MQETGLQLVEQIKPTLIQLVRANMPSSATEDEAQRVLLREMSNLQTCVELNPALKTCSPNSYVNAIRQCICDNLSLSPSSGLVYLIPGRVKVGQEGNTDIYEWVMEYKPSANGKLSIARQTGRILDFTPPEPKFDSTGKVESISVSFLVPSFGEPRWQAMTYTAAHFEKWQAASAKKNKGAANANYTSWNKGIDPEFAGSKAISHGLKRLGINPNELSKQQPAPQSQQTASQPIRVEPARATINTEKVEDVPHTEINPDQL